MRTLRYAVRQLAATPGFTAVAILIVAIGIGASTAMFSTVHAVVLKPLSLPEADRLVAVYETNLERNVPSFSVSVPNYVDFKARATSFTAMAAVTWRAMNLTGGGEPQLIQVRTVTANFLRTLGVPMAQGRDFAAEEDRPNGPKVAVISNGFWRRHFGGRPDVVGQTLRLDGDAYAVVGVTAAGLPLPGDIEIAVPMQADAAQERRLNKELDVFARLAPGVSIETADRELQAIAAQIAPSLPAGERGWRTRLVPLADDIVGDGLRRTLLVLLGAVGLLLLVACANLSNLLLVRASARGFELAVRRALGESRGRAIAQLLVESLVVTAIGGALGIVLASWSVEALRTLPIARMTEIAVDPRVVAVAIAATVMSGILAGVGPAVRASHVAPQEALQSQAVRLAPRSRLRDGMIVAQLGLSLTLLVGAALVARSFWSLLSVDPGFSVDHVVTMAMRPSMEAEPFYEAVGERVRALPGVESAGFISTLPLGPGGNTSNSIVAAGSSRRGAEQSIQSSWRLVDGGYFKAMRIPLLRGRTFDGLATDEAVRSIVLSNSLARALFGDDDPVGREVDPGAHNRPLRVIGVVGDVRSGRLATDPRPAFYWSFHRFTYGPMRLVVKSHLPTEQIIAAVRREVRAVDTAAPIFQVATLEAVRADSLGEERLLLQMLWAFAGTALLLAALGTYGVVAFAVQQRTREFGIRMAIGADASRVRRLVLAQAARLVAFGSAVGLVGALATGRLVETLLFGVTPFDIVSYLAAVVALSFAVLVAAWWPARRAARVNPLVALAATNGRV
ncbi:MAG: ABC transporter permease [Vicinamibacteraceae bacterium]